MGARWLGVVLLLLCCGALGAIDAYEFASDEDTARFNALIEELRCPQCLNTNIAGSDAPISADLRRTVAEMINAGRSDDEIREFLHARYGDFILYRPRLTAQTALLWFGPGVLLVVALTVLVVIVRRGRAAVDADLTADERARLARLGVTDPATPNEQADPRA